MLLPAKAVVSKAEFSREGDISSIYKYNSLSGSKETATKGSTLFSSEPATMKESCGLDILVYQLTWLEFNANRRWRRLFLEDGW